MMPIRHCPKAGVCLIGRRINSTRVISDNGSDNRSRPWKQTYEALGLTPKRTRLYTPRTDTGANRFF